MKTRNKMKKLEQEKFVIPKTVQNVIPIKAVYKDGIFLVGKICIPKHFSLPMLITISLVKTKRMI